MEKGSTGAWVERLFKEHKFMRRFTMFWAMGITSTAIWLVKYTLDNYPLISDAKFLAVAGLVGTLLVLVGTAIALYRWDKKLEMEVEKLIELNKLSEEK